MNPISIKIDKLYTEEQYRNTLQIGRIGSAACFVFMLLSLYADYKVFHYPHIISIIRLINILILLVFFIITLTPLKSKTNFILRYYYFCLIAISIFPLFFHKFVYDTQGGIYNNRIIQIFLLAFMGVFLFSAGCRGKIHYIFTGVLALLTLDLIIMKKPLVLGFYEYFNVYAFGIITSIMAYKLDKTNKSEFRLKNIANIHLSQLKKEIEARKKIESILKEKMKIDGLTKILNRKAGFEIFQQIFNSSKTTSAPLTICFIDLDDLKYVNDNFGHNVGDQYILTSVQIIKESIRDDDIVMRLGGDEFLIIFPNTTIEAGEKIWEKMKNKIKEVNINNDFPYVINFSHGMATQEYNCFEDIKSFVKYADEKMYEEKRKR